MFKSNIWVIFKVFMSFLWYFQYFYVGKGGQINESNPLGLILAKY